MAKMSEKIKKLKEKFSLSSRKTKSVEELSLEFSSLQKKVEDDLRRENKMWQLKERVAEYEEKLTPFVKENPKISDALLKEDFSDNNSFALIRGMVCAMREKPELAKDFLPKMTAWASGQEKADWFLAAGLNEFVKKNPEQVSEVLPLFEVMSNNPPKEYNQKSNKEVSGGLAWECRENTKDYFLLAEALVLTKPNLVDKVDTMVGKFKKQVSLLDAISVEPQVNGGKISERTPQDWTYYHDRYETAKVNIRKDNIKKMSSLKQNVFEA